MNKDELFMKRALDLAQNGIGKVSPNPMVGCVIVYKDKIIGEGWHRKYGEAHAEVNAVNSIQDKALIKKSTAYVTLEPCSHFGKTPPCTDLLIKHDIKKVVICNKDLNKTVEGKGIKILKENGIEIQAGMLEKSGETLNKRYFTYHTKKRPYIILKWAQTGDGFLARKNYVSKWISNKYSRKIVHKWRTEEDAIMVGTNTAQYDNPNLTSRDWAGKNPLRIVLDKDLRLKKDLYLFDQTVPTLCFNLVENKNEENLKLIKLKGDEIIKEILAHLYKINIQSLIVEGGAMLLSSFIKLNLWDEVRVFKTNDQFREGIHAPDIAGSLVEEIKLEDNVLEIYSSNETN